MPAVRRRGEGETAPAAERHPAAYLPEVALPDRATGPRRVRLHDPRLRTRGLPRPRGPKARRRRTAVHERDHPAWRRPYRPGRLLTRREGLPMSEQSPEPVPGEDLTVEAPPAEA